MCITHFSNRRLGAKDPLPSRRRFIQSFLNIILDNRPLHKKNLFTRLKMCYTYLW